MSIILWVAIFLFPHFMSFLHTFLFTVIEGFSSIFNFFINYVPFVNQNVIGTLTAEKFHSLLSNINRISLFLVGITVSANIYLFTTKNKMSSTSVLVSRPVLTLSLSLIVNFLIISLTTFSYYFELMYGSPIKPIYKSIVSLTVIIFVAVSLIIFGYTLWKFVNSFRLNAILKKANDNINNFINYNYIKILVKEPKIFFKWINSYNVYKNDQMATSTLTVEESGLIKGPRSFLSRWEELRFSIILWKETFDAAKPHLRKYNFKRHKILKKKEMDSISKNIEIYTQQIIYLIEQNSKSNTASTITNYNNTISELYTMLLHIEVPSSEQEDLVKLFSSVLDNHSDLIIVTSKNYGHAHENAELMSSFFKVLQFQKDEHSYYALKDNEFHERLDLLYNCFFTKCYQLIAHLIKVGSYDVLEMFLNNDLFLKSFLEKESEIKNTKSTYAYKKSFNESLENVFISVLNTMIEERNTLSISHIVSVLITISTKIEFDKKNNEVVPEQPKKMLGSSKKSEASKIKRTYKKTDGVFSNNLKKAFIYSIIKANEIEEYKIAGYLTKVLTSYTKLEDLVDQFDTIFTPFREDEDTIIYLTSYKITYYNLFSFNYCFSKTIVMILIQFLFFDGKMLQNVEVDKLKISRIETYEGIEYFLEKLKIKNKEYNMISLNSDSVEKCKLILKQTW